MIRILAASLTLASCTAQSPPTPPVEPPTTPAASSYMLPQPNVTMEADPPPPFTYWAPEGSVIRNHPNAEGVWIAHVDGRMAKFYFGDQCGASELQRFVGEPLQSFTPPAGAEVRTVCSSCAMQNDLRVNRINVMFDEATQRITEIACH